MASRAAAMDYDYERLIDLAARIGNCAHKIDLSDRTAEGNSVAFALSAQIATDVIELQEILRARQAAIEAGK